MIGRRIALACAGLSCLVGWSPPCFVGRSLSVRLGGPVRHMHLTSAQRDRALALTLFGDARGEGFDGMRLVGFVAMNRLAYCRRFDPDCQIEDIVLARKQWSCWNRGDPNVLLMLHIGRLDPHSIDGIRWTQAKGLAHMLLAHRAGRDPTHGARFYHTRSSHPRWDHSMRLVLATAHHLFYAWKGRTA